MKLAEFYCGVYAEPVGYLYDRCRLCGADMERGGDEEKVAHLMGHEQTGMIERAGPKVGWRLCFGHVLKQVSETVPREEMATDLLKAKQGIAASEYAISKVADYQRVDLDGPCQKCGRRVFSSVYRVRATGDALCYGCALDLVRTESNLLFRIIHEPDAFMDELRDRAPRPPDTSVTESGS